MGGRALDIITAFTLLGTENRRFIDLYMENTWDLYTGCFFFITQWVVIKSLRTVFLLITLEPVEIIRSNFEEWYCYSVIDFVFKKIQWPSLELYSSNFYATANLD